MTKLLTISIPTWNRAALLNELLSSICSDLLLLNIDSQVQLLVSNNASDDPTEEVVMKYKEKYNFISYNKNTSNIGAKSNVLKSMELAETPYVMFIGDDDRLNVGNILPALKILASEPGIGVLIDTCRSKFHSSKSRINVAELAANFYWYMGNAGYFITKVSYIRKGLSEKGYDFFNECWPHTQLMLLGLCDCKDSCFAEMYELPSQSSHGDVMIYSSYYLWRTVVYDLRISAETIRDEIGNEVYLAAMLNMKRSCWQNFLNILQCGVFIDTPGDRIRTTDHIKQNLNLFIGKEKVLYMTIYMILKLPAWISKMLSNIFILLLKGNAGIKKKNNFVKAELLKRHKKQNRSVRMLEFET